MGYSIKQVREFGAISATNWLSVTEAHPLPPVRL